MEKHGDVERYGGVVKDVSKQKILIKIESNNTDTENRAMRYRDENIKYILNYGMPPPKVLEEILMLL